MLAERRRTRLEHLNRRVASGGSSRWGNDGDPDGVGTGADGARARRPWGSEGHSGRARRLNAPRRPGPLRRGLGDRLVGGVASGVSARTGIDPTLVRAAFVLSTVTGGVGIAAYVLAWLFVPLDGEEVSVASRAIGDRRGIALAVASVPLLVMTLVVATALGATWMRTVAWPLFLAAGGLVLLWRNVSAAERSALEHSLGPLAALGLQSPRSRRMLLGRIVVAVVLAFAGGVLLTRERAGHGVVEPLGGLMLIALGVGVAFGPWWVQIVRDLVEERQARARAEERADIAARIHDSVLQTLALVQRHANDPHRVVTLARAQERELRAWLFEGRVPGSVDRDASLAVAIERIQVEVESLFGVPVEAVLVGDGALNEDLQSLLEAAREATVNAAKWSGAPEISLFAEVEPGTVTIYVRDRGKGFDEEAVAPDRRGLAESIRGRMARHGGTVEVRTALGEGTEVTLRMPRR